MPDAFPGPKITRTCAQLDEKKEDVKNKDLWVELYNLNQSLDISWNWVKAHAGNPLNEEVDLLAKKAANLN